MIALEKYKISKLLGWIERWSSRYDITMLAKVTMTLIIADGSAKLVYNTGDVVWQMV
jgi:hypothetical protein